MSSRRRTNKPGNAKIKREEALINEVWDRLCVVPGGDIELVLKEVKHHKTFMQHRWLICHLQQMVYNLRSELSRLVVEEMRGINTTDYIKVEKPEDVPTIQEEADGEKRELDEASESDSENSGDKE